MLREWGIPSGYYGRRCRTQLHCKCKVNVKICQGYHINYTTHHVYKADIPSFLFQATMSSMSNVQLLWAAPVKLSDFLFMYSTNQIRATSDWHIPKYYSLWRKCFSYTAWFYSDSFSGLKLEQVAIVQVRPRPFRGVYISYTLRAGVYLLSDL